MATHQGLLKPGTGISEDFGLTEKLLKSSFHMTTHNHIQV
jgi:hypothetical protein